MSSDINRKMAEYFDQIRHETQAIEEIQEMETQITVVAQEIAREFFDLKQIVRRRIDTLWESVETHANTIKIQSGQIVSPRRVMDRLNQYYTMGLCYLYDQPQGASRYKLMFGEVDPHEHWSYTLVRLRQIAGDLTKAITRAGEFTAAEFVSNMGELAELKPNQPDPIDAIGPDFVEVGHEAEKPTPIKVVRLNPDPANVTPMMDADGDSAPTEDEDY